MIFCEWSGPFAKYCENVFKFIAVKSREISKDECAFVFIDIFKFIAKYFVNVGKSIADTLAASCITDDH